MKRIGLVLVAGGSGLRMGNSLPKQFISINGKPILQHTIDLFLSWNKDIKIVLVLAEDQIDYWLSLNEDRSSLPYSICKGGKERFYSVQNGLKELRDVDEVMIHDGVRPLLSKKTLNTCLTALGHHSGVIPVITPSESIRMIEGDTSKRLNRDMIRMVQTPQCFHYNEIIEAYQVDYDPMFTDDASVFENMGQQIHLVEGNRENIKITRPEDLHWAKIYLQ